MFGGSKYIAAKTFKDRLKERLIIAKVESRAFISFSHYAFIGF